MDKDVLDSLYDYIENEFEYVDLPGDQLLPFESSERYNDNIKIIFEKAGVTYLVTKLDTVTRTEVKVPINEIASSHMARRTFIGNIYQAGQGPESRLSPYWPR